MGALGRGSAMRLAAVLLRDDDKAMEHRLRADERTQLYADASTWLTRESEYLRKTARVLDKPVQRLNVVLERHRFQASSIEA